MGLFRAMTTGATGMFSSSTALETIGDNIANLNTTAFKTTRADQESLFALTLREGQSPVFDGGLDPMQVGLGSAIGAIQRNFVQGTTVATGVPTDLALDGRGFFMLTDASGAPAYTRDGAFQLNAAQQLQSRDGLLVQGWQADDAGDIDTAGVTGSLDIPLGLRTLVRATTEASVVGNLDSGDIVAGRGAVQRSAPLLTDAAAATPATAATALTALVDGEGRALFADGDVVEVGNVRKGELNVLTESAQFTIGADGGTVQDLLTFLEGAVAIHTDPALPATATDPSTGTAQRPGITLDSAGRIVVASNVGATNAVVFDAADIVNATSARSVFLFETPEQSASGQGVSTEFKVFDSLGGEADLRLRLVQESRDDLTTTWRWYAESLDDSDASKALQTGTLTFDADGQFVGADGAVATVNLSDRGAADVSVSLDFSRLTQLVGPSEMLLNEQNGAPLGVLEDFSIDEQGVINGGFSNGVSMTLGQVAVALFTNPAGLKLVESGNYTETVASGAATVSAARENGAGRMLSSMLEQSNVELAREFIGLINTSTQFSASSRVITAADELLQELLLIAR